jgi:hypothetical protein
MIPEKVKAQARAARERRVKLLNHVEKEYGGALALSGLMRLLGLKDDYAARKWVQESGLVAVMINGRRRYPTIEVVEALERSREMI